ncbi:ankyrin repeat domain-containing protein [Wolbachia endosymbiont of Aedes albopictus]|uniref:ankyrin repeat domain-containing protein n=1 Tax=Wolbachia endosymbiont of Aedes albopictus TaxID=167957 RepID=UPI000BBBCA5C|nr:ankyrin repeat domain-containing protein [Wolbachia endosymbiont of Aedes albopictus]UVW84533.1 ankyrin repeat domain-containing protein [Wolbachia endosymbiont of Aedes albopictus]
MLAFAQRLRNMFRSNLANNPEGNMEEGYADGREHYELQELRNLNSQFFDICEREGVNSGINFLSDNGYLNRGSLSKVINTKNREGKDVITLVVESDNLECISTAFEYLTHEDFNRKGERDYTPLHEAVRLKSSNAVKKLLESEHVDVELLDEKFYKARKYIDDKETAKLFVKCYDEKISNLSGKVEDSNKKLVLIGRAMHTTKCIFGLLAAFGSVIKIYEDYNAGAEHNPIINTLGSLGSAAGLFVSINYCVDAVLSSYRKKSSSLKKERENFIEERYKVERKLYDFRKEQASSHTGTNLVAPRVLQLASVSDSVYSPEMRN